MNGEVMVGELMRCQQMAQIGAPLGADSHNVHVVAAVSETARHLEGMG
jgi:hypothetical protein